MGIFNRLFRKNKPFGNLYLVKADVVFNKKAVRGLSFYINAKSKYEAKRIVRTEVLILPKSAKKTNIK